MCDVTPVQALTALCVVVKQVGVVSELVSLLATRGYFPSDSLKFLSRVHAVPVPSPVRCLELLACLPSRYTLCALCGQGDTVSLPTVVAAMTSSAGSCLRFHRDGKTAASLASPAAGVGIGEEEAVAAILRWCAPILFSLMDSMDVIRLLGAVLTENKVVALGGSLDIECVSAVVLALVRFRPRCPAVASCVQCLAVVSPTGCTVLPAEVGGCHIAHHPAEVDAVHGSTSPLFGRRS
jgi:hypothetical protein